MTDIHHPTYDNYTRLQFIYLFMEHVTCVLDGLLRHQVQYSGLG